jgi:hypothetical protein
MDITAQNADAIVARLDGWRTKASAAGRDNDVDVLDAVIGHIRQKFPVGSSTVSSITRGFIPRGTPVVAKSAEVCPYNQDGVCQQCEIDKFRLFTIPGVAGRAYACFSHWCQAVEGRDKSFVPLGVMQ